MSPIFALVLGSVLAPTWAPKWLQNWPKISPKSVQTHVIFTISFFRGPGALQVTLGNLLGLPKALLGVLRASKTFKNIMLLKVFERHLFAALELLMALRGQSCHARGRSGTKKGPQKAPKSGPKVVQKLFKHRSPKRSQKGPQNYFKMVPKIY